MINMVRFLILIACVAVLMPQTSPPAQHPFQNPDLPIEQRIDNILSLMTIDEKIECLDTNPSVPRLGIKASGHVEGIHGLTQGGPGKWGRPQTVPSTTFPQGIGLGETWDKEILRQAGEVEGYEARYVFQSPKYNQGGIVIRSPNADIGRDPRWGRNEECYGEDAYFNGAMVVAFSKGLQGNDPKYWQSAALMKHFLANSNENDRDKSSSNFDERLFHEYYSLPFRMGVIEGGSRAYMAAYNAVNGVPMTINPILQNITRDQWGQDGIICTDAGAMKNLVTSHKYYPDFETAAAKSVKAGIGQFLDDYRTSVRGALKRELLTEADIDRALRGNFRVMIRLGLLDPPSRVPYSAIGKETVEPWLTEKHKAVALLATQKSIVLLKNSANLLPLDKKSLKSIAVIGPRSNEVLLDWYSGTPPYAISPLEGIKNTVGESVKVNHALNNDAGAAVKAARESDVAIVCVGNHPNGGFDKVWARVSVPSEGREAVDRQSITLEQEELIKAVFEANPKTIVVLKSSFPYAINWTQQNVPAILHLALNSQEEGRALATVLFGDYNPAGRLVQTWPASLEQLPPMMDYDIRHGRTYMYFRDTPLYPFGYGLSYTSFAYRDLKTSAPALSANGSIDVSVVVKNTGQRAGDEVVQLYVRHLNSSVSRPLKELKDFARVRLAPQEQKTVKLSVPASRIAYWNSESDRWVVEKDRIEIAVGGSSTDARLKKTIQVR
ncbi:MAG TPA: glycoside hydrolase family 3 C-terminal domain-containing protein [Pyrinomonadaceae bacterium]|jgi:beta-glucosidase|nr:glycoside hydrolase family 3 C-terminal domain-containing protein [Pyrinomonadaceae bacterium]